MQIAAYSRPVHTMSVDAPDPVPFPTPSVYLVWRRPRTDEVVFHRAGLVIGRALDLALSAARNGAPMTMTKVVIEVAREANMSRDVIYAALDTCADDIAVRDGIRR